MRRMIILIPVITLILVLSFACNRESSDSNGGEISGLTPLPDDIPTLVEMLGEPNQTRRNEIMDKLVAKGEEAVPELIAAMAEGGEKQAGAMHTLALIGEPAIPALLEALGDDEYYTRYGAIMAFGEIGRPASEATEPLISLFRRTVIKTEQIAIMHSLEKLDHGEGVLNTITAALIVDDLRFDALRVFADIGPDAASAVPSILPFLENENSQTRFESILALEGIGPVDNVVEGIAGILNYPDEEARVKTKAAQVLGGFGEAAGEATTALANFLGDESAETQRACARALGQIAPASSGAIPALINALQGDEAQTRREAAWALGQFGAEASSALDALRAIAENDEFDYVRTAATQSIALIEG